jgi:hypothetical protein
VLTKTLHGQVKLNVNNKGLELDPKDEIGLYLNGRFLCSMDTMWRILGYQTYPASNPTVVTIKVKLESVVTFFKEAGKCTDMLAYLLRPIALETLTYEEMFSLYLCNKTLPIRFTAEDEHTKWFYIEIEKIPPFYIFSRLTKVVCRMEMLYLTVGEGWFYRLILKCTPVSIVTVSVMYMMTITVPLLKCYRTDFLNVFNFYFIV